MTHCQSEECSHSPTGEGLCPDCREQFEADPDAWYEFGDHASGRDNWVLLRSEMAGDL